MKKLIIILFLTPLYCYSQDTLSIKQETFVSVNGKHGLITVDRELFHSVIHGSLEFLNEQAPIEFNKALQRRKTIAVVKAKCK